MNKVYRLVWSDRLESFVAVPEFARSCGKSSELTLLVAVAISAFFMSSASAQINVASGNTTVSNAANGVPVVAIATANAAGLSHNKYNNFNVASNGLVLNNNASAAAVASQLAVQVGKNNNLTNAASVILNEVVTANRSQLKGYMEVAGSRADVVVANPWGITCDGCGFINTDRATLSTGVPVIAGDGRLDKLRVNQGDILISGAGLKGVSQNILDIVTRSVVVSGDIKANDHEYINDLQLVAGNNDYSYANRTATKLVASGPAPSYAIDSTLLGGMYAQRISLIATEQGVGVRMLGDAAANGGDFTLSAAGTMELRSKSISAEQNLSVTSSTGNLALGGTALLAGETLALKATVGDVSLDSSSRAEAVGDVNLEAGLTLRNQGLLKGTGDVNITAAGGVLNSLTTSSIESGGRVTYSGRGALNNQGRIISALGFDLDVSSLINGGAGNYSARIASAISTGNFGSASNISAITDVINYGSIHSKNDLTISANSIKNQSTGGITSINGLDFTAKDAIENRGALYSAGGRGIDLKAVTINNYTGATIGAISDIWFTSSILNNYAEVRANSISVETDKIFYNGLETPVTALMDFSTKVTSAQNEAIRQIDFWQENKTCLRCDERWLFQDAVTYREKFSTPLPAVKPQMLALDTLSLEYGNGTATNHAGILSGDLVSISGSGKFTNKDVTLSEITYYRRAVDDKEDHWHWSGGPLHGFFAATAAIPLNTAVISDAERAALRATTPTYASETQAIESSALFEKTRVTYSSSGAGVYANTLLVSAGQVENLGSPLGYKDNRLTQGGFTPGLPTNPNGQYVLSGDPKSRYLVVANPDFEDQVADLSTLDLEKQLGFSPDDLMLRLGDKNYEDYLIRQQVVAANATPLLAGNEAAVINRLRGAAVAEAGAQKLEFGKELTSEQIKRLGSDIVWMVKTTVGGKTVLAPRVYLSESTRAMITGGAVMAAQTTSVSAASVTNRGATITGAKELAIRTTGNITNESGTISGGELSLAASGSIINKTLTQGQGNVRSFRTNLNKTALIEATEGSLEISAGQQIAMQGAEIKGAKDVALSAVGAIVLESITEKTTASTSVSSPRPKNKKAKGNTKSSTNTTTTTEKIIGSSLVAGEQLSVKSGADVTLKGSTASAGGTVDIQAKGDARILAEQNKTTMRGESKESGRGVGGGLFGKKKQITNEVTGTNAGSTLTAVGSGSVNSTGKLVVQGSQVKIGGNADLKAGQGIDVSAGKNEHTKSTQTTTTTFLKIGNGSAAAVQKPVAQDQSGIVQASAKAEVGVSASAKQDLKLFESTVTKDQTVTTTSVGSSLTVGGNLTASTDKTLTLQGSNVNAGKAMNLQADKVDVVAGTNRTDTTSSTSTVAVGLFVESQAKASAQAKTDARGSNGGAAAGGSANAKASADATITLGLKTENENQKTSSTTNDRAALTSGGNMNIGASKDVAFTGAKVVSGGNLEITGANITNTAVQNVSTSSVSKDTHLAGAYISGSASAGASANAGVQAGVGASAEVGVKAEAKAEVTAGVRYKNEQEKRTDSSVTQVTNTLTAQNNITRTAGGDIKDQGTQIQAGGSVNQTARTITDQVVSNSTTSSLSTQTHDARIGVHAGASADAGATASATLIGPNAANAKADAAAGVGVKASYLGATNVKEDNKSAAVTTSYTAGKNISSVSSEKTTLQGAKFDAGNDVSLQAGTLDFNAAKNTSTSSVSKQDINAQVTVTVVGTPGVNASGGYVGKSENVKTSTELGGSIKAGGNLKVNSGGDVSFTGTQIKSDGKTTVAAQGNVNFNAAQSSKQSSSQDINTNAGIKVGAGSTSGNVGVAYGKSDISSTTGQGAKIDSTGGVDVNAGKSVTLVGATVTTQGNANVTAGNKVNLLEVTKTESQNTLVVGAGFNGKYKSPDKPPPVGNAGPGEPTSPPGASVQPVASTSGAGTGSRTKNVNTAPASVEPTPGANASSDKPTAKAEIPTMGVNASLSKTNTVKSTGTSIGAGGAVTIQGGTVVNQGAELVSGKQEVNTTGVVQNKANTNETSKTGFEFTVGSPTKK